jgi:hypothetical protein
MTNTTEALQHLIDKDAIRDVLYRYARGVDRGDWELMRSTYHSGAYDDHGEYKGSIEGLIVWLEERFTGVDNSMHFFGNCLIDFAGRDVALVETSFVSRRLRAPNEGERKLVGAEDAMCREAWGRFIDHFERRNGEWRVAKRYVVLETASTSIALGGVRNSPQTWGQRNSTDRLYQSQAEVLRT